MAKVLIEQVDGRVKFTFTESSHYQFNGTADWPLNSLSMTIDSSDMVTFKNQAGDIVYSILLTDLEKTKAEMEELYAQVFVGSTGGGGVTPEDVQTAIDDALAPVNQDITDLSNDVAVKEEVTARALTDLHENKLDVSAYTPTVIDATLDATSPNAVANSAITTAVNAKVDDIRTSASLDAYNKPIGIISQFKGNSGTGKAMFGSINGVRILQGSDAYNVNHFSLLETSAVTTSMTSSSTDAQVPSAKAVYDQFGGLKLVKCTQAEYSAMEQAGTLNSSTLYVVTNVV